MDLPGNSFSAIRFVASRLAGAAMAAVATLLLLVLTSPQLPMGWDEGNAIHRAEGIQRWASRWTAGRRVPRACPCPAAIAGPMSREAIEADWQYTTRIEGHPALYGIVLALGHGLGRSWLAPLESWRLGPMLLFALAAGAMFYRLAADESLGRRRLRAGPPAGGPCRPVADRPVARAVPRAADRASPRRRAVDPAELRLPGRPGRPTATAGTPCYPVGETLDSGPGGYQTKSISSNRFQKEEC